MQIFLQSVDQYIRLIIRSVLNRNADASRYLYGATEEVITQAIVLREKLERALKN
jgi:hypothetical protein